jgi:hypothetical protein
MDYKPVEYHPVGTRPPAPFKLVADEITVLVRWLARADLLDRNFTKSPALDRLNEIFGAPQPDPHGARRAFLAALSERAGHHGQVLLKKLVIPDGWHVTAEECSILAEVSSLLTVERGIADRDVPAEARRERRRQMALMGRFVRFCGKLAVKDGFVVVPRGYKEFGGRTIVGYAASSLLR